MEIAKALLLAGCRADDRPWPTAPRGPKHLFPLANRPILVHNLEALRAAGVLEATILTDPDSAVAIERVVGDGSGWGLRITYAEYVPAVGIAGALAAGSEFLSAEPVLVQEGGALLRERIYPHLAAFARERLDVLALCLAGPRRGAAPVPEPGYMLSARAVATLMERTDAAVDPVAGIRACGGRVRVQRVDGALPCHGDQAELLECNRRMLADLVPSVDGTLIGDCTIQGPVVVDPSARLQRTTVRGPAVIGANAILSDAYVGPYTSIGAGAVLDGAEIEHSIVLDHAELRYVGSRLESSVIGHRARIVRSFSRPSALRISVGEGAEVLL